MSGAALRPVLWLLLVGVCMLAALSAWAQVPPVVPPCDAQLEAAQQQIFQLRKVNAQSEFSAATAEERVVALQKELKAERTRATAPSPKVVTP